MQIKVRPHRFTVLTAIMTVFCSMLAFPDDITSVKATFVKSAEIDIHNDITMTTILSSWFEDNMKHKSSGSSLVDVVCNYNVILRCPKELTLTRVGGGATQTISADVSYLGTNESFEETDDQGNEYICIRFNPGIHVNSTVLYVSTDYKKWDIIDTIESTLNLAGTYTDTLTLELVEG